MSIHKEDRKKITTTQLKSMKSNGEKISVLTAYDYTTARILDDAGIDVLLVGDSASNTMVGNATTLSITLDQMIYYAKSVVNGVHKAMVIVDMPFGTVSGDPLRSLHATIRVMRETGADAIKVEGGAEIKEDVKKIIDAGIPVMAHLGLMPQSINKYGTYAIRGKSEEEAQKLMADCLLMEELGAFGILLEKIPSALATEISQKIKIPTIGIGAGPGTDGQVLVIQDLLGMNKDFSPKFLRRYADLHTIITEATTHYIKDVKENSFPNENESYK
ncbi:3-methyl-2-oxobutanoate hydroxymethyltransferase [Chryseobacterium sp. MOF25P]|uniref:3-methyl-2-oxobutanoate hydroxymethyltransferase n=1 Tax=unclassified Chryseobacterium TaxID=2593645 RepID=UPI000805BAF5|nr:MULTISPECIES: 3-methyl-2-oxobutanoate hydroxymethyltransferase [unclassified Chryseobacterium]OBW43342.1 3-methyl-2-oxobutanoate hydroxymethyltransferase [Chryseobacterium sp. MOF25P]OBW47000.1 3-methyl-2-oxobutanoate hydroxymethyltransferase [Chryseobacterium sp. BGARF1]